MKKLLLAIGLMVGISAYAQEGSVGIGTQTPNNKAVLHLVAPNNDQGLLIPKLTTIQRTDFSSQLTTTENGMMVYDSDLDQFFFWMTDHWEAVGSSLQAGTGVEITNGVINNTGDADNDPVNELQNLDLTSNILTITGISSPTQINLASYTGTNTDAQDLRFTSGQITLTGDPDNTIIDLSNYDSNVTDDFSGDWADLAGIPTGFLDGTDEVDDADSDPANELQDLDLTSNILTISGLSSPTQIDLAPYSGTNTDEQDLQFSSDQITLSGDPDNTIIDLSPYLDNTDLLSGITGNSGDVLKYFPADGGWQASTDFVDDADSDPTNEIEFPATTTSGYVMKYNGSSWVASPDNNTDGDTSPTNEIELPESEDLDKNRYAEYSGGNYIKALNFLSTPMEADFTDVSGGVLDITPYKFNRTLLFTPETGKGSSIDNISINNGISGQELILINVGVTALSLTPYTSGSNLYLPGGSISLNPGGSIHFIYVNGKNGFKGWVTLSFLNNVEPGAG